MGFARPRRGWLYSDVPNLLTTELGGLQPAPFAQMVWPNPTTKPAIRTDIPPNLLTTFYVTSAPPFFQTDWPNPSVKRIVQPESALNLLTTLLGSPFTIGITVYRAGAGSGPSKVRFLTNPKRKPPIQTS